MVVNQQYLNLNNMEGINANNIIHVKADTEKNMLYVRCVDGNCLSMGFDSKEDTIKAFNVIADKLIPNFIILNKK